MDQESGQVGGQMIDWRRPWFAPWREPGQRLAQRVAAGIPLHDALNREPGAPLQFVAQEALPAGQAYERFVRESGACPVRPGLHDFFNGLVWLRMPRSKAGLNRLQAAEIDSRGVSGVRGAVRDAVTLFDENGALLDAPSALWSALLERDWRRLFVELRPLWSEARLLVVGHALLEKLVAPRKELTAHVWRSQLALDSLAQADALLAGRMTAALLEIKPLTPLPLLGVPGWWPDNREVSFYDDGRVFRPRSAPSPRTAAPVHPSARP